MKILAVDDFEGFRKLVCSLLQRRPEFEVTEASDGREAVQKAEELQPDLILLDVGLPTLNGLEVARRVRKLVPRARILFLTVESDPDVVQEALNLGALGYVHKSRTQADLLPAIEAVLRGEQFISPDLGFNGRTDTPGRHAVHFYSTDSVFLDSFGRFIATALKANDAVIVLATKSHRESLVQKLKGQGFDIDGAIQQGTYLALDAADMLSTIMVNGEPDPAQFFEGLCGLTELATKAANTEHPRVAICGECVGLLCAAGDGHAAVRLEKIGNLLIKTHKHNVDILCAYPLSSFPRGENDQTFDSICAEHTAVYSY